MKKDANMGAPGDQDGTKDLKARVIHRLHWHLLKRCTYHNLSTCRDKRRGLSNSARVQPNGEGGHSTTDFLLVGTG